MRQSEGDQMIDAVSPGFAGAKLALFLGEELVVLERDDRPGLPWPGYLDLPGGGRENGEVPEDCVIRETWEELGLRITPEELIWRRFYPRAAVRAWFFVARLAEVRAKDIRFGDEGQGWMLMYPHAYLAHRRAIPHFQARVREYLSECV